MIYKQTTQVPNIFFDQLLLTLTEAEIKLLLVIMRPTYGWIDPRTVKRKQRNRNVELLSTKNASVLAALPVWAMVRIDLIADVVTTAL